MTVSPGRGGMACAPIIVKEVWPCSLNEGGVACVQDDHSVKGIQCLTAEGVTSIFVTLTWV